MCPHTHALWTEKHSTPDNPDGREDLKTALPTPSKAAVSNSSSSVLTMPTLSHPDQGHPPSSANVVPQISLAPSRMHCLIHSGICHDLCVLSLVPAVPSIPSTISCLISKPALAPPLGPNCWPTGPSLTTVFHILFPAHPSPDPSFLHQQGHLLPMNSALLNTCPMAHPLLRGYTRIMAGHGLRDLQPTLGFCLNLLGGGRVQGMWDK